MTVKQRLFSLFNHLYMLHQHGVRTTSPMDATQRDRKTVLMLPWPAYGHISPFLQLAKKLTKRDFYIYFCSTPVNLDAIKAKLNGSYSLSIRLVQLHPPSMPELPPHYHTTNGLPTHLIPTLVKALEMAGPDFYSILKTLNPYLLIYDFIQLPWAPKAASSLNIPAVQFLTNSATMLSFMFHRDRKPRIEFPFEEICLSGYEMSMFNRSFDSRVRLIRENDRAIQCSERSCNFSLIRTFREIEAKYLDYATALIKRKLVPVGPLLTDPEEESEAADVVEWLNKRDEGSAVVVSFGSEYSPSEEELKEIALGLELSEVDFIWVVRFPTGEKIKLEDALPEGFLKRVGERGMVVEGWAPQRKILGHSSTGGFVSHCGWSSVMEAMEFGVPIIAMPMSGDQPFNAKLVEAVGVGREVKRDEKGKLGREEIAKVIKRVMDEKNDQENHVRRKAGELREIVKKKGDEEIDAVVEELLQLCHG